MAVAESNGGVATKAVNTPEKKSALAGATRIVASQTYTAISRQLLRLNGSSPEVLAHLVSTLFPPCFHLAACRGEQNACREKSLAEEIER
ncbi:unnamed protein product [Lampetra planeri]